MLLRLVFTALLCASTFLVCAQADTTQLRARLTDYGRFTTEMQLDSLLDYIDPELFEIVDRPTMRATFALITENPDMDIRFRDFEIDRIGAVVDAEGDAFAPVTTRCLMSMRMTSEAYREPLFLESLASGLRRQYGTDRVRIDKERAIILVDLKKTIFAVRRAPRGRHTKSLASWHFLEHNAANPELLDLLVPSEVRQQFDLGPAH